MKVHTAKVYANGERHDLVVLEVLDRDEKGRPKRCRIVYDDTAVPIVEGQEFVTAYVHHSATEGRS